MSIKEIIEQLNDLIRDRESFISSDEESNKIYKKDIIALKSIIEIDSYMYKELNKYKKIIEDEHGEFEFKIDIDGYHFVRKEKKPKKIEKINIKPRYTKRKIEELQQKNEQLKERIDKAIELIPKIYFRLNINGSTMAFKLIDSEYGKELLEKLKGDSNE